MDAPEELAPPPLPPTPFSKSAESAEFERAWLCAAEPTLGPHGLCAAELPLGPQADACAEPPCAPVGCFGGPERVVPRGREAQGDARWEAGDLAGAAREYARAVGHHSTVEGGAFPPTAVSVLTARGWLRLGIALSARADEDAAIARAAAGAAAAGAGAAAGAAAARSRRPRAASVFARYGCSAARPFSAAR